MKNQINKAIDEWISSGEYQYTTAIYYLKKRLSNLWISVRDRLPPVHFNVLVWCGKDKYHCDHYHIARIDKYGCWYTVDKFGGCNPILWCPLPDPPESEGDTNA